MPPRDETRPITYSKHAEERLAERGVAIADVDRVIRAGAWQRDGVDTFKAFVRSGRVLLQVVFADKGSRLHVITVKNKEW
jgi:hypothetical protein